MLCTGTMFNTNYKYITFTYGLFKVYMFKKHFTYAFYRYVDMESDFFPNMSYTTSSTLHEFPSFFFYLFAVSCHNSHSSTSISFLTYMYIFQF